MFLIADPSLVLIFPAGFFFQFLRRADDFLDFINHPYFFYFVGFGFFYNVDFAVFFFPDIP